MVAFAGERVLELEAPIRNDGTKERLAGWGRTQDEVEGGRRRLEPAMVRECFEYLFSKVRENSMKGKYLKHLYGDVGWSTSMVLFLL